MGHECKCPKCSRFGLMMLDTDISGLPFIQCHACGGTFYKHIIERELGLNVSTDATPEPKTYGKITNSIRAAVAGMNSFHVNDIDGLLPYKRRALQNALGGMIRNGELERNHLLYRKTPSFRTGI